MMMKNQTRWLCVCVCTERPLDLIYTDASDYPMISPPKMQQISWQYALLSLLEANLSFFFLPYKAEIMLSWKRY